MQKSFFGYRRDNGRVGIRNHVLILPLDDLSQPACDAVANNIGGTVAIQHPYGRLQFGADLDLHFRTLIGAGSNPNVAAVIVIGIEEKWTQDVVDGIAKTGKPVAGFGIEQHGQIDTIARASRKAKEFVQYASALQKVECPISDLWVSCKCGESDTTSGLASCPTVGNAFDKLYEEGCTLVFGETTELTGGEHLVKARCANDRVRSEFTAFFDRYAKVIDDHKTSDLSDSQPTKGNIEGGLTTIEEKALGNIQKIGTKAPVIGTLDKAVTPTGPGLWFMDSSSAAAEMITLVAAAGYVVHFFPTGQGNIIGNPIVPVIKLSTNPRTIRTMSEHMDVDVSGILRREMNLDQAGDKLLDMMFQTIAGRMTAAEALKQNQFVMTVCTKAPNIAGIPIKKKAGGEPPAFNISVQRISETASGAQGRKGRAQRRSARYTWLPVLIRLMRNSTGRS
ncbi:MAG: UxaA family hydrolase [Bilophila wadsworthia]